MPDLTDRIAEMGVIRPGDRLVIRFDRPTSTQEIDDYRTQLAEAMPGIAVVFVQAEQALIIRPADEVPGD